jgi:hypothetical protein
VENAAQSELLQAFLRELGNRLARHWPLAIFGSTKAGICGISVLLVSVAGYGFAACWLFTAMAKPFAPDRVGLWQLPDPSGDLSLSLGRRDRSVIGHDLLGWWIIPVGIGIAIVAMLLTNQINSPLLRAIRVPGANITAEQD